MKRDLLTSSAGIKYTWEDAGDGEYLIHGRQDVEPLLDVNKSQANHNDGYTPSREMRRVATIPVAVRNMWLATEGWDAWRPDLYAEKLMQKLNDASWQWLRTAPGRLGVSNGVMR